jgi:hypothetical protein
METLVVYSQPLQEKYLSTMDSLQHNEADELREKWTNILLDRLKLSVERDTLLFPPKSANWNDTTLHLLCKQQSLFILYIYCKIWPKAPNKHVPKVPW